MWNHVDSVHMDSHHNFYRRFFNKDNTHFPLYIDNQLENKITENNPFKLTTEMLLTETILSRIFSNFNTPK